MKTDRVFSEVYSVLQVLGNDYISKISNNVMNIIENNRDLEYSPEIDRNKSLNQQNISQKAINMIAKIDTDFWCETNEEKKEMYTLLESNKENFKG